MRSMLVSSSALGLGFRADNALMILWDVLPSRSQDSAEVFQELAESLEALYLTSPADLASSAKLGYLRLRTTGLLDTIQGVAHKEGRMADQMAERAVRTLRDLSDDKDVSPVDLEHTKKLLEFVSKGTSIYVEQIRESRVPHFP